jgi:hypothetical protein
MNEVIMTKRCFQLGVGLFVLLVAGTTWAQTPGDYPWTTGSGNVSTIAWTKDQIGTYLATATNLVDSSSVGDFRFADLLGDGNLELVATIDVNGRAFYNEILVVRRIGANLAIQHIPAWNLESLSRVISDLNGDGKQELQLPTSLSPYLGAQAPQVEWTAIYAWTGKLFQERTAKFAAWYTANILPPLQRALANAQNGGDAVKIALAQLELDKAVRVSGGGSETGLANAQTLATCRNPILRIWAASALADIGTPAAQTTLATLLQDPDPDVALYADAAQKEAALNQCSSVPISVLTGAINLSSGQPIKVSVGVPTRGNVTLVRTSPTFGEGGFAQSLISCNNDVNGMRCLFTALTTGLQVGDGVATLRAKLSDGSCIVGQAAVLVVAQ